MMRALLACLVCSMALLTGCGGGGGSSAATGVLIEDSVWQVGISPSAIAVRQADGWAFDIPTSGSVNYITKPAGSLAGKTKIVLHARIEAADGTRFAPPKFPDLPASMTLYFQRAGDDWSAQGKFEAYRWYAGFATVSNLKAGDYVVEARFDGGWTAVLGTPRASNPEGFQAALANADRIGFVLGGGDGLGHGIFATGPAKFVITDFQVQ